LLSEAVENASPRAQSFIMPARECKYGEDYMRFAFLNVERRLVDDRYERVTVTEVENASGSLISLTFPP